MPLFVDIPWPLLLIANSTINQEGHMEKRESSWTKMFFMLFGIYLALLVTVFNSAELRDALRRTIPEVITVFCIISVCALYVKWILHKEENENAIKMLAHAGNKSLN